jgi:hypothetical protein
MDHPPFLAVHKGSRLVALHCDGTSQSKTVIVFNLFLACQQRSNQKTKERNQHAATMYIKMSI